NSGYSQEQTDHKSDERKKALGFLFKFATIYEEE
ncbi:uncharacterized, partial [Tachysurus ichikawai]